MVLKDRLLAVRQTISENVSEGESGRRLPDSSIAALKSAMLFRTLVPKRFGGLELRLLDVLDPLVDIGSTCPATAWVAALFVTHNVMVAWFDKRAQSDVWGSSPDSLVGSSLAPANCCRTVTGGVVLSGKWSFSSGIDHADWLMVGSLRRNDYIWTLIPRRECEVVDDWHFFGLRGTGSKSFLLRDVFVPIHRIVDVRDILEGARVGLDSHSSNLYRVHFSGLFGYCLATAMVGAAIGAFHAVQHNLRSRRGAFTGRPRKMEPLVWKVLADCHAKLDLCRLLFRRDLEELESAPDLSPGPRRYRDMRTGYNKTVVANLCLEVANELFRAGGASMLFSGGPLERFFRDIHAISQHPGVRGDDSDDPCSPLRFGQLLLEDPKWALSF